MIIVNLFEGCEKLEIDFKLRICNRLRSPSYSKPFTAFYHHICCSAAQVFIETSDACKSVSLPGRMELNLLEIWILAPCAIANFTQPHCKHCRKRRNPMKPDVIWGDDDFDAIEMGFEAAKQQRNQAKGFAHCCWSQPGPTVVSSSPGWRWWHYNRREFETKWWCWRPSRQSSLERRRHWRRRWSRLSHWPPDRYAHKHFIQAPADALWHIV